MVDLVDFVAFISNLFIYNFFFAENSLTFNSVDWSIFRVPWSIIPCQNWSVYWQQFQKCRAVIYNFIQLATLTILLRHRGPLVLATSRFSEEFFGLALWKSVKPEPWKAPRSVSLSLLSLGPFLIRMLRVCWHHTVEKPACSSRLCVSCHVPPKLLRRLRSGWQNPTPKPAGPKPSLELKPVCAVRAYRYADEWYTLQTVVLLSDEQK